MINPIDVVTDGYFTDSLGVATMGFFTESSEDIIELSSGGGFNVMPDQLFMKERVKNEDEEIIILIKAFLECL